MSVIAVLVTYFPPATLSETLANTLLQVDGCIIIDNSADYATQQQIETLLGSFDAANIQCVFNTNNLGLGRAQNIGIETALRQGATHILLLDQDSTPADDMVQQLLMAKNNQTEPSIVGLLSPTITEEGTGRIYPALTAWDWLFRRRWLQPHETHPVFCAFASGSLISARVFYDIGLMRDELFIEGLDWDFCARLHKAGYVMVAVGAATLHHRLGNQDAGSAWAKRLGATNHSPERRYIAMKNRFIVLYDYAETVPGLAAFLLVSTVKEMLVIILAEKQKWVKLRAMFTGIWAGITAPYTGDTIPRLAR